jgi:hypothetical protein
LFNPCFYIPYFLRAIRLKTIFDQHKKYVMKKKKDGVVAFAKIEETYCLREGNLAVWFFLLLLITISIMIFSITTNFVHVEYVPNNNV